MRKWSENEGEEFKNSDNCYGREYDPGAGTIDIAVIKIRGIYPGNNSWGWLEEAHEMAVVTRGKGYIETKLGVHHDLVAGDVVYVEPKERFRWGGDMDLIISCGPAFNPKQHHIEEES